MSPRQRRQGFEGHGRRPDLKGEGMKYERVAVGVREPGRSIQSIADVEVGFANIILIANQVARRKFPFLPCYFLPQSLAESDDVRLPPRRDAKVRAATEHRKPFYVPDLPVDDVSFAHRQRGGVFDDLSFLAGQDVTQCHAFSRLAP